MIALASVGADGAAVDVADDVGLAALHDEQGSFGEAGGDHAQRFGVVGSSLDDLAVIDRGELRVDPAGGLG